MEFDTYMGWQSFHSVYISNNNSMLEVHLLQHWASKTYVLLKTFVCGIIHPWKHTVVE